eukprot:12511171-Heterocapsa_arctica.AAC.1
MAGVRLRAFVASAAAFPASSLRAFENEIGGLALVGLLGRLQWQRALRYAFKELSCQAAWLHAS